MTIVVVLKGRHLELANIPDTLGAIIGVQDEGTTIRIRFSSNTTLVYENGTIRYEPTEPPSPPAESVSPPQTETGSAPPPPPSTSGPIEPLRDTPPPSNPPPAEPPRPQDPDPKPQEVKAETRQQEKATSPSTTPPDNPKPPRSTRVRKRSSRGGKSTP